MALQIIAKFLQKLCIIFEIFCHTNCTQNQYKSFATIFKIFVYIYKIILNYCKRFAILFKNLGFLDKISQNQCKIFVLWSKTFVFKCKKVVKNGIIWIKSKQTVKNFLFEERCWNSCHLINFKIWKRSKTRKNHLKTNSDFQRNYKVSCVFAHCCMLSFLLVLKYFLLTHYSYFPVIFARFWLGTLSESSFPVMCLWKYIRIQQKWKQMIWKSIKNKRSLEIWKNSNRNSWKAL